MKRGEGGRRRWDERSSPRVSPSRPRPTRFSNLLGAKCIAKYSHASIRTRIFSRKLGLGVRLGLRVMEYDGKNTTLRRQAESSLVRVTR
jgi:hypothetical protein